MTWHAKAMATSYATPRKTGAHSREESGDAFLYSTTSWYFLNAVEVFAPSGTKVVAAFGDSITDGTGSPLKGDDRWPDALARRLHADYGTRVAVVNLGIGGNRVAGPAYSATRPAPGGPTAVERLEREVLSVAGLTHVIWLQGVNDFSQGGPDMTPETVIAGYKDVVGRALGGPGDGLHPNRAGYQAMANAVDLT
jgi:lysophospholipase L1-like esterase